MSRTFIDVLAADVFEVRVRPDLAPDEGGLSFVEMGSVRFTLPVPRLVELRDAITAALNDPVVVDKPGTGAVGDEPS